MAHAFLFLHELLWVKVKDLKIDSIVCILTVNFNFSESALINVLTLKQFLNHLVVYLSLFLIVDQFILNGEFLFILVVTRAFLLHQV